MATTTNYSWTTPDDTALVKDGAAAIRTLGSSVDTTVKNLNPETTLGDISYRSSTANVKTRLALGTAGQLLAVNSGATAPEWKTISTGGMTLINTGGTALSGSTTSVTSIPTTYKHLLILVEKVYTATAGVVVLTLNNDTGNNYTWNSMVLTSGTYTANSTTGGNGITWGITQTANTQLYKGYYQAWIYNYTDTESVAFSAEGVSANGVPQMQIRKIQGSYDGTAAVTRIDVTEVAGGYTFSGGRIYVYGVS